MSLHPIFGVAPVAANVVPSQAEAEAGTATIERAWTAERVKQAIAALESATSISNTAITAVTNIDLTGFASGTYDNYKIIISNGQPANDVVILEMETSTDGGSTFDTGASDYSWARHLADEQGTGPFDNGDADDTEIQLTGTGTVGNAANENFSGEIIIYRPEDTEFTAITWNQVHRSDTGLLTAGSGAGERQSAADVDAVRFHWSAGDWVAQGSIQFLGIAQ